MHEAYTPVLTAALWTPQVGAALKALSQQIKSSGADVGIGVATMLGFEDTVKLFRVRAAALADVSITSLS